MSKEIETNKNRIISLLRSTGREGIENVIDYLKSKNYFILPSSLARHHNWEGGLAEHNLGVYERLVKTGENILPIDSIILTSLLHDICKIDKIYKEGNEWKERNDDELEIPGHGERSVKLLEKLGLSMNPEEESAIRWHMGGWKINEKSGEEIRDFFKTKKSDLWRLLHNADRYDASHHPSRQI